MQKILNYVSLRIRVKEGETKKCMLFFFFPFAVFEIGKEKKGGDFEETLTQNYSDCRGQGKELKAFRD